MTWPTNPSSRANPDSTAKLTTGRGLTTGYRKLGEVCHIYGGNAAPQDKSLFKGGTVPFVRMQDLGRYHSTTDLKETIDKLTTSAVQKLKLKVWGRGVILIPRSGSVYMNHRAILGADAVVVSHIAILADFSKEILPHHLFYYLTIVDMGRYGTKTTGIDSISFSQLGRIKIPLPSLKIQKQIVERLDKIAKAQKLNDELIQKADELFQSLLHKELNPAGKDWEVKKLSEIGDIITGTTPFTKNANYWNGEFLWATPTDIKENTFILTDTPKKLSREGYEKTRPVPKNAILVTCIASIGKMALAGKEMATNQQINSIVCNETSDPFFVFFSLQKNKKKLIQLGKTAVVPIINKSEFGRMKILLPPLKIQKQIVEKLSAAQEYKKQLLGQKSKLKELFESVLNKSMKGELVK